MDAIEVLARGSMEAAARLLNEPRYAAVRTRNHQGWPLVVGALRQCLKTRMACILNEWKAAAEAKLEENWLRDLLNAQAIECAMDALNLVAEEI